MYLLKVTKDEDTASMLCGADAVLIVEAGAPKRLELLFLPNFGLSCDQWDVFVKGVSSSSYEAVTPGWFL